MTSFAIAGFWCRCRCWLSASALILTLEMVLPSYQLGDVSLCPSVCKSRAHFFPSYVEEVTACVWMCRWHYCLDVVLWGSVPGITTATNCYGALSCWLSNPLYSFNKYLYSTTLSFWVALPDTNGTHLHRPKGTHFPRRIAWRKVPVFC